MLASQINAIISDIVAAFTALLQESAIILWNILINQGFRPDASYGIIISGSSSFFKLYNSQIGTYLPLLAGIAMAGFSITLIAKGPENKNGVFWSLMKPAVSVLLAVSSIFIVRGMLRAEYFLYDPIWNSYGGWQYIVSSSTGPYAGLASENLVTKIFFIAGYDIPIVAIFIVFAVRISFLIFSMIILPFISLLLMIPYMEKFVIGFWKMVIGATVLPVFMILAVYPMVIISGNSMVQIGSLFLCASVPLIFMERGRIFSSLNLSSITGAVGMESLTGMAFLAADPESSLIGGVARMEMSLGGVPDQSEIFFGNVQNPFAIDWNRSYERSYSETP
ncbi:MAG: hypothetical protein M1454_05695 [Candidatus Thermoplasmatota archaeon]|nr:hypothetical protein [Candidatus Thermoplasmatota archaeon]MCL5731623.1 hypothetical protein [Candidatus Thermoplasmatota archaeon]